MTGVDQSLDHTKWMVTIANQPHGSAHFEMCLSTAFKQDHGRRYKYALLICVHTSLAVGKFISM
ncbi:hypothetical protein MAR_020435 [Mya arenaria]|uniref:Uncharacterized protein n=1 Tax=Mya arenaria TaxID=6604 RepID=A0ABY7ED46_MYAAR|nr:hypothetical protein MAR_020435 [Mya arenaria]